MWPFKKKEAGIKIPSYRDEIRKKEKELFEEYQVGADIRYMGIDLKVVKHEQYIRGFHSSYVHMPTIYTALICDYIDRKGVIRRHDFSLDKAMLIEIR